MYLRYAVDAHKANFSKLQKLSKFEYLFVSPYGVGASDEPAYWQVFVEHPLDVNPITNALYGQEWFYVQIDAKTGEVSDSLSRGFFSVDTRLK